jgi:hypothetical protein
MKFRCIKYSKLEIFRKTQACVKVNPCPHVIRAIALVALPVNKLLIYFAFARNFAETRYVYTFFAVLLSKQLMKTDVRFAKKTSRAT